MHKKKPFCLGFVALLLSMATVTLPVGGGVEPPPNALYVWPDSYLDSPELDTLRKGDKFTVDVMVKLEDGVNLTYWAYQLEWDSTKIELTSYTINLPAPDWLIILNETGHLPDFPTTYYHYSECCTGTYESVPCVTPRSIATYNFTVLETIYEPEPDEIGALELFSVDGGLWDQQFQPIIHTFYCGEYRICAIPIPNALYVWPDSYTNFSELDTLKKGDTFTVDVMVNVTAVACTFPATGLYGWDYVLEWDSTNINLTSYTVNIPPEWGNNWFKPKDEISHYPAQDLHLLVVQALAPAPPLNETTTTMPISVTTYNFTVLETIYEPEPDEIGTIAFQDNVLYDDMGKSIPHNHYDGQYRKCAISPLQGDINSDGIVDIFDLRICATAYGCKPGDTNWNPNVDLNNDGLIDVFDLRRIAKDYGKTWP